MNEVQNLAKKACVIVISHRLANVTGADNIYMLNEGKVIESGNHKELCDKEGEYSKLYNTQKSLEDGYKQVKSEVRV